MFYQSMTFIGIDPTAGKKPFSYAALDADLRLMALGQCEVDEVLAFVAGQRQAVVAVNGPRQPNQGLMQLEEIRQKLSPAPKPGRWTDFRVAEYLLRQHNIPAPQILANVDSCPRWVQMSFRLFRSLLEMGYVLYPQSEAPRLCLEVYPHAAFGVLLGMNPRPKNSLEGRLQRQLALHEQMLKIPDPMNTFEEVTRHRLLKGIFPVEHLYPPGELDALVAAFTAWTASLHPERLTLVGDPAEGQVALPVTALKARY